MKAMILGKVSDRLITERERWLKVGWGLGELLDGSVELAVGNIVPGEPIRVRWRVVLGLRGTDAVSFSIRLFIDGQLVHVRTGIPAEQATVGGGVMAAAIPASGDHNTQVETIVVGDPNLARSVYRIGAKQLSAEVRGGASTVSEFVVGGNTFSTEVQGAGSKAAEFAGSIRFRVVPETVDATWWEWRVPAFESIEWKKGYTLAGAFVNRSRFASMALVKADLSEVRSEENPHIDPCDFEPVDKQTRSGIAAGGHADFSFALKHDWSWIVPGAYVIKGPINKTFAYAVIFEITDQFGNVYTQCSTRRHRHIGVSKGKRLAAVAAQTASINSLVFLWIKPLSLIYKALAAFFGVIAKDPPAPDLAFREPVRVVPLPLPRWSKDDAAASFPATASLLETAAHLAALENSRTVSRARLLGARLAGDEAALEQQQDGYLKIEQRMIETARKLGEILPAVQKEVDNEPRLDPKNFEPSLRGLAREGLPETTLRAMAEGGVDLAEINGLDALVRDQELIELACANGLFLVPFVISMQRFVQEVEGEREMVLAGESYVPVPRRNESTSDEAVPDVEARLRPSRRRCCQVTA